MAASVLPGVDVVLLARAQLGNDVVVLVGRQRQLTLSARLS